MRGGPGGSGMTKSKYPEKKRKTGEQIAAAIVNYNTRDELRACLVGVIQSGITEIVVVDNASSDGSAEMVRQEFPQVHLEANPVNTGYGSGANRAIALCSSPFVLLLNSDTLTPRNLLEPLCQYLDLHPQAAVVGPRLLNLDGTWQASFFHFPSPLFTLLQATSLGKLAARIPLLKDRYLPASDPDQSRQVPWVLGAALVIRRSAFEEVGGFDESYFMFSEEVDLCYRLQQAGWQVHYAPVVDIVHIYGASTSKVAGRMEAARYLSTRRFYELHYNRAQFAAWRTIIGYSMLRNLARDAFKLLWTQESKTRIRLQHNLRVWKQVLKEGL